MFSSSERSHAVLARASGGGIEAYLRKGKELRSEERRKTYEMDIVVSRGFSVYGWNFDIRVGRAAFQYSFDLILNGLHYGHSVTLKLEGQLVKHTVQRRIWVSTPHLLQDYLVARSQDLPDAN
jgi:hypothetical protein